MSDASNAPEIETEADQIENELRLFEISDEALETAAGFELGPQRTGCSSYCPATSCPQPCK